MSQRKTQRPFTRRAWCPLYFSQNCPMNRNLPQSPFQRVWLGSCLDMVAPSGAVPRNLTHLWRGGRPGDRLPGGLSLYSGGGCMAGLGSLVPLACCLWLLVVLRGGRWATVSWEVGWGSVLKFLVRPESLGHKLLECGMVCPSRPSVASAQVFLRTWSVVLGSL